MSADLEQFLAGVRDAEDPSPKDEERVMRGVRAALAAGVVSSVTVKASALSSVSGKASLFGGLSTVGGKLGVVAVGGALALGAGYQLAFSDSGAEAPRAASEARATAGSQQFQIPPRPGAGAPPPDLGADEHREDLEERAGETRTQAAPVAARAIQSSPPVGASPAPASLEAELALLSEVQAALRRGDGDEALAKLDAHETKDQQLSAERSAARIAALCAVGSVEEAQKKARVFLREHPRSVQRAAVLGSCAKPAPPDEP